MEQLFLLAEKITGTLKVKLSVDRERIGVFNFEKAIINNSSFEIHFSSIISSIKINLSTHYLDMPWAVKVFINSNNLNHLKDNVAYEVYPNLLKDPDGLGFKLAKEIGDDVFNFLTQEAI